MAWTTQEISRHPMTNLRREFEVKKQTNGETEISAEGIVWYLTEDGERINKESIRPYLKKISCAEGQAPYVDPETGAYTEPEYDEDGNITNGVIARFEFLKYVYFNTSVISGDLLSTFIENADIAGEFNI